MLKKLSLRILVCCLTLCCALGLMVTAQAADPASESYTCRVHYRASTGSSVIGLLEDGAELKVLDTFGQFYYISCWEMNGYILREQAIHRDGKFYVNCDPESKDTRTLDYVSIAQALRLRGSVMELSRAQLGKPYIYGSMGTYGFDCSGLTSYIFKSHEIYLNRCADDQMQDGLIIPRDSLHVGDLLFFREPYSPWLATHVGIYAGDGRMIHAASGGVQYSSLDQSYYASRYVGARRVINVDTDDIVQAQSAACGLMPMARSFTGIRTAGIRTAGIRTAQ